ncbi:hypothetical protein [Sulfitobacter guttiformis]|uniref:Uncharacterized protein n=1 Tax=Sulfitobacter guttiformis TaxID=74349 RepID=A0A420DSD8_9RHOB|nr:hypothetical protein [Sulfitobacter guttiformis]KIN74659.1 hypothetical protein Z949_3858 [Sulfitobacter guttiformis KCTC 32187]RKE97234.1 hypothetical protein C8N30_1829 [Sulfitobacter guttiformis]
MQPKSTKPHLMTPAPRPSALRQLIVCGIALVIMGLGAWTLLGQSAPYHPETGDSEVSRRASGLTGTFKGN